jgi:hypothetical protein
MPTTGIAGEERCEDTPILVTGGSPYEHDLACSAGRDALRLLGRCGISVRRSIHVQVAHEVRHPFSGPAFGLFDTKYEKAFITRYANIASLVTGTPFAGLPRAEICKSQIVHEIVHA